MRVMSDDVRLVLGDIYDGMRLRYVIEDEPLGTAGPVRLAFDEGLLERAGLRAERRRAHGHRPDRRAAEHERTGARATLALSRRRHVELRRRADGEDGQVEAVHREGRGQAPTNRINAGAYVIERERRRVGCRPGARSPSSARCSRRSWATGLYGFDAAGYWIDIGTPERYLEATWDLLAGRVSSSCRPATRPARSSTRLHRRGAHIGPHSCWAGTARSATRAWSARCSTTG